MRTIKYLMYRLGLWLIKKSGRGNPRGTYEMFGPDGKSRGVVTMKQPEKIV